MYPDELFNTTWYLMPEENLPYDERRDIFHQMREICKDLCSDIGHADMLIQFDDETELNYAKDILTEAKIKWVERER